MTWLQTYTGKRYDVAQPLPSSIDVRDIAHHLSLLCRYAGATKRFYSVAEHSVHVAKLVPAKHALTALLHDATEAYLCDLPRPVKAFIPGYKALEAVAWDAVAMRFDLPHEIPQCVHDADVLMLYAERRQLLVHVEAEDWGLPRPGPVPNTGYLGLAPLDAEALFLARYDALIARR
jgi:uncharacterized protein